MFGLFKKKSESGIIETPTIEPPVIIPPAKDRSGLPTEVFPGLLRSDKEQISNHPFIAVNDEQERSDIFNPAEQSIRFDAEKPSEKTASAYSTDSPTMPLPQPGNIFSKTLPPPPSSIAMIANRKSVSYAPSASSAVDMVQIPLVSIIKSLPSDTLAVPLQQINTSSNIAQSTVALPLENILAQLPTGKIEFPFKFIANFIPGNMLQKNIDLETPIRLPLNEVVSKIPQDKFVSLSSSATASSDYKSVAPPFTPSSGKLQEQRAEVRSIFGELVAKSSASGGSGSPDTHLPEAPPPGLGMIKPKPPIGAIASGILSAPHFASLPQNFSSQPLQNISTNTDPTQSSPANLGPTAVLFPKIAPPPPEANVLRSENTLPTISLAPTSKTKPTAIGGTSRIGQSSALTSRENLATLAKLAAQSNQGFTSAYANQEEQPNPSVAFKTVEHPQHAKLSSATFPSAEARESSLNKLSQIAAPEYENDADHEEELPPQPHSHNTSKQSHPNFTDKNTDPNHSITSGQNLLTTASDHHLFTQHQDEKQPLQLKTQEHSLPPEEERAETITENQFQISQPNSEQKTQLPFKAGLLKPVTKPTLFRSPQTSSPSNTTKQTGGGAFRLRPIEGRATNTTSFTGIRSDLPATDQKNEPDIAQQNRASFDEITPPLSGSEKVSSELRNHPAARANKTHTQFSSNSPTSPIRATASIINTPQTRRSLNLTFALARWLGLESDSPVPIESVPVLLTNSPYIKGAAVVDAEGLTLSAHLPYGLSENAIGALTLRLYQQAKTAATEMGSTFEGQCVVSLGRWTLQITHAAPYYLATFHDGLDFPPALARRLRKVAAALVRQETAS